MTTDLNELINERIRQYIEHDVDDMLPCKVVAYSASANRVDVQPLVDIPSPNGERVKRAIIKNIPVYRYGSGGYVITLPLKVGDFGWVKAADRETTASLKDDGKQTLPISKRLHTFGDGMFLPDTLVHVTDASEDDIELRSIDGNKRVTITSNGINQTSDGELNITATDDMNISSSGSTLGFSQGKMNLSTPDNINISSAKDIGINPGPNRKVGFSGGGIGLGAGATIGFAAGSAISESSGKMILSDSSTKTDATANRALRVGDFGLGNSLTITDANTTYRNGFYRSSSSTTNVPVTANGSQCIVSNWGGDAHVNQIWFDHNNNPATVANQRILWKLRRNNTWHTKAFEILHTGKLTLDLGKDRATNGTQSLNFYSVASSGSPQASIVRNSGANGSLEITNTGTGDTRIYANNVNMLRLWNNATANLTWDYYDKGEGYNTGFSFNNGAGVNNHRVSISHGSSDNGTAFIRFSRANSLIGSVSVASSSSVSYNTSSDYRLKENILPIENAMEKVMRLNPVSHTWRNDKSGQYSIGFLAHELQEEVPSAVTGVKDEVDEENNPVYQGVDYSKIVPLLTAALQEAQLQIEVLNLRLQEIESK